MDILKEIASQARNNPHLNQCNAVLTSLDPYARTTKAGHITASGLVIKDGRVLLIFHPYIQQWFQPGGHIDEGESPVDAAIREVYEETGYVCELDPNNQDPIDIDIHGIPANPKKGEGTHIHIDLLYCLRVLHQEMPAEKIDFDWFSLDEVKCIRIKRALVMLTAK
jgi:8-oxo-dGTP pyrophosphatase MutT (NUDIX family)